MSIAKLPEASTFDEWLAAGKPAGDYPPDGYTSDPEEIKKRNAYLDERALAGGAKLEAKPAEPAEVKPDEPLCPSFDEYMTAGYKAENYPPKWCAPALDEEIAKRDAYLAEHPPATEPPPAAEPTKAGEPAK